MATLAGSPLPASFFLPRPRPGAVDPHSRHRLYDNHRSCCHEP